ncbi:lysylphosphatidylglycerol synthase domain-containing protein [Siccirubricoccus sp. KC 17139]|uniref:Lysylphosphatidylglycerol synthase domain-containing protein n=1 Tax=Siccirubricoccus soli TaxID=2899147 RepID=A0ABT1DB41_9PROT|nr:lysylphosphatidylglycerol synthase domain-containing protein [Siccirubricoccus soli]MCO6419146.1 lysylphosphatidylglycerol synthase domain-containing protein [Siccirubricoccus soli]MCP2685281.1 lysylphosphatidylglycerol synthase domain-containing protein [Siccirubricoccus soli]
MNRLGPVLAVAGLAAALALLAQQDLSEIGGLLAAAGFGLVLAALAHIPSMALNGHAWRLLLPRARRPSVLAMTANVWIRESVNGLLPVARIGGEIASYRLLRGEGVAVAPAAASLMVDMAISILSQLLFALLGLALLAWAGAGIGWGGIALGALAGVALAGGFILAQRADILSRLARLLNGIAAGRFPALEAHSARIDRMTRRLWRVRGAILGCFLWQLAGWAAGALEIWLALYFLGFPVSVAEALAIEALIQAVSSAAFLVPGALGLQEAGFLGLGLLLGLPAEASAALAIARRLRDLVVFLPGLLAWVWAERRMAREAVPA